MTLREKALEMRSTIDGIELALHGIDRWEELNTLWEGARADLTVKVEVEVGVFRQIYNALAECNRIINSPEYTPANLLE